MEFLIMALYYDENQIHIIHCLTMNIQELLAGPSPEQTGRVIIRPLINILSRVFK